MFTVAGGYIVPATRGLPYWTKDKNGKPLCWNETATDVAKHGNWSKNLPAAYCLPDVS